MIGHEIGHYLRRHSLERLRDVQAKSAFATLFAPFGLIGLAGQLAVIGSALAFSREQETEADHIGLALMKQSGHDPREASKVWANLRAELSAGAGGDPAKRSVFWATHPGVEQRQQQLQQWSEGGSGFVGAAEFQARLEPLLWELFEEELKRAQYDESLVLLERHSCLPFLCRGSCLHPGSIIAGRHYRGLGCEVCGRSLCSWCFRCSRRGSE